MADIFLQKTLGFETTEIKTEGDKGVFSGYASKFNGVDSYGDTILPGAYAKAIKGIKNLPIFLNHDKSEVPLGVYTVVKEDERGLYVEGQLTLAISKARDVFEAMKAGSINGLSVGLGVSNKDYTFNDPDDPWSGRTFKSISALREISVCTYPADDKARISVVKSQNEAKTVRDLEESLRDAGFSKADALSFISTAKAVILDEKNRRDSETEVEKAVIAKIRGISQSLKI